MGRGIISDNGHLAAFRTQQGEKNIIDWWLHFNPLVQFVFAYQTFATDAQTTDSAASAFAIYSGVKTNHYTMGYDNSVIKGNATHNATAYDTIYKWAQVRTIQS